MYCNSSILYSSAAQCTVLYFSAVELCSVEQCAKCAVRRGLSCNTLPSCCPSSNMPCLRRADTGPRNPDPRMF